MSDAPQSGGKPARTAAPYVFLLLAAAASCALAFFGGKQRDRASSAATRPVLQTADASERAGADVHGEGSADASGHPSGTDVAPGDEQDEDESVGRSVALYVAGLCLAALLTAVSFSLASTGLVYGPGLAVALTVLAIAQMGVHLVFFLHIDTSPDSTNNVMALAFGILIVFLLVAGSLWIMAHLNGMMSMPAMMEMGR